MLLKSGAWFVAELASCKPSALAGLVFVALLEGGVGEGDVPGILLQCLLKEAPVWFSSWLCYHLCSELCWCDSLLRARAVCRAPYVHRAFILLPKVCKVL